MKKTLEYETCIHDSIPEYEEKRKKCTHDYLIWLVRDPKGTGKVSEYSCLQCGKSILLQTTENVKE